MTTHRELTDQQRAFVREYVANDGNGAEAARTAGYTSKYARQMANSLLQIPHVLAALHIERERRIGRIATVALGVLEGVLLDDDAPIAQKVKAAGMALDRAGHTPPKRGDAPREGEKRPEQMNKAELEAFIRRATRQLREETAQVLDLQAEAIDGDAVAAPAGPGSALPALAFHYAPGTILEADRGDG